MAARYSTAAVAMGHNALTRVIRHAPRVSRVVLVSCDAFDNFPSGLTGKTLVLSGKLTIRGVTKPVTVDFELTGAKTDPPGDFRVGFEQHARARADRAEFPAGRDHLQLLTSVPTIGARRCGDGRPLAPPHLPIGQLHR